MRASISQIGRRDAPGSRSIEERSKAEVHSNMRRKAEMTKRSVRSFGLWFGVWGLGFGVWELGFGVWGLELGI